MRLPLALCVHGMGRQPAAWLDTLVETLDASVPAFAFFAGSRIREHLELVPVAYDDILRDGASHWDTVAADLMELADREPWVPALVAMVEGSEPDERAFFLDNVVDVVLFRFHQPTRFAILSRVRKQLAEVIAEAVDGDAGQRVSVVAHGLGTAVAHDAIHALAMQGWTGLPNVFAPEHWRFTSISMLSNCSRALESTVRQAESVVRPGPSGDPDSYCETFINARHRLDPLPIPRPFSSAGFPARRTLEMTLDHFHAPNVHGFAHYLMHPKVHTAVLKAAIDPRCVTPEEQLEAKARFPRIAGRLSGSIDELRDDLALVAASMGRAPDPLDTVRALLCAARAMQRHYEALGVL